MTKKSVHEESSSVSSLSCELPVAYVHFLSSPVLSLPVTLDCFAAKMHFAFASATLLACMQASLPACLLPGCSLQRTHWGMIALSFSLSLPAGAIDACLSHGLKRRALGLFKTNSTTALIQKVSKNYEPAAHLYRMVQEIENSESSV